MQSGLFGKAKVTNIKEAVPIFSVSAKKNIDYHYLDLVTLFSVKQGNLRFVRFLSRTSDERFHSKYPDRRPYPF